MLPMPGFDGRFPKKRKGVFVVRDEAPCFSEALQPIGKSGCLLYTRMRNTGPTLNVRK